MKRHVLLVLAGILHAFAAVALGIGAAGLVLDRYTSATTFGTAMQVAPFIAIATAFIAYPAYLVSKKRAGDAMIVLVAAVASVIAIAFAARMADAPSGNPIDGAFCPPNMRDSFLSEEERAACPNWCPYRGPLLGGNYWAEEGEECVYL